MLSTLLVPLALSVVTTASPAPAPLSLASKSDDPPVKVWLSQHGDFFSGQEGKVYARSAKDGYIVVFQADTRGRIRVLYPVDPNGDQSVRGGKKYELKGRGGRKALELENS